MTDKNNKHPHSDTAAAKMLRTALRVAALEGQSLRETGRRLRYKQPVALSHMSVGRIPIPVERAIDIARVLGLPANKFMEAVLRQRYPELDWDLLLGSDLRAEAAGDAFVKLLESAAGCPVERFTNDQREIMGEVAASTKPKRRWLSVFEIDAMERLRRLRPNLSREGLSDSDIAWLEGLQDFNGEY